MIKEKSKNIDQLIIDSIIGYIETKKRLKRRFNYTYKTQKYDLKNILPIILFVLKQGISWRSVSELYKANGIHWNTIYKTYVKLVDEDILSKSYESILKIYYSTSEHIADLKYQLTDTTIIINKGGIQNIMYNGAYPNHKICKVSSITDAKGITLNIGIFNGNMYDSKILENQLNECSLIDYNLDINNRQYLLADSAYDSKKLTEQLIEKGYSDPLIRKNKRNIKDKKKLEKLKMNKEQIIIYKKRIKIEHTFCKLKKNKRINVRYDKKSDMFLGFIFIGLMDILYKKIRKK
jgi:transposase